MSRTFTIDEAATQLSKLVALAEEGERVRLRRDEQPVVELVPILGCGTTRREPGALAGRTSMADDFDTWPDDVAHHLGVVD